MFNAPSVKVKERVFGWERFKEGYHGHGEAKRGHRVMISLGGYFS